MSLPPRLTGRLALVTGASRGIGRAAALALAEAGAHVILLARTTGALEEVDDEIRALGGAATLVPLDLRKFDKVDALGPTIYQRWGKLDILVGNAATLGPMSPLGHVTADAWAMTMEINVTANWRLIRTLDPLLRRSEAGRAVFVSSAAAHAANAYMGPYAVSKAALEMLVRTYAAELGETNVRANLIDPGPVRTAMRAKAFPGEDASRLTDPAALGPLFVELAGPDCASNGVVHRFADWRQQRAPTAR
jgi:NAD(P)-dependent dehydrogenase (short-subunit alcohol dehydrogenase family)